MLYTGSHVIGHVVDVQGHVLTVALDEDEQGRAPTVTIGDEDVLIGQLGSYVAIKQNDVHLLAVVTRMTEQEVLANQPREVPGDEAVRFPFAKRIARLTPVGSILTNGEFERGVARYPTTGAEVHAVGSMGVAKMFARFQAKGLAVGRLASHPSIQLCLDPTGLFGRHSAILGQTGSGKSWTLASLIQRTVSVMPMAHIIILDLHGEYCWKERDGTYSYAFRDTIVRHVDARELEMPYWLMNYGELCDLLIDRTEEAAHNQIAFFRETLRQLREKEKIPLGLQRVTVDTPVYFSLPELLAVIREKNSEMVQGANKPKQGEDVWRLRPRPYTTREPYERCAL